jgi:hypothetical protein
MQWHVGEAALSGRCVQQAIRDMHLLLARQKVEAGHVSDDRVGGHRLEQFTDVRIESRGVEIRHVGCARALY